jgi:hypothetical protein
MTDAFAGLRQPGASSGLKIPEPVVLARVLECVDSSLRWEVSYINQVEWDGHESDWRKKSWDDTPLVLDDMVLRAQAADPEQVINGRFTGFDGEREVVMIEAVDSTFWLVWSDDEGLRDALIRRFPNVTTVAPPTEFHPLG